MFSLLFLLLSESPDCHREAGSAQCIEIVKKEDGKWHGRASCYTKTNKDGGYDPHLIKCVADTEKECQTQLDQKAKRGCND